MKQTHLIIPGSPGPKKPQQTKDNPDLYDDKTDAMEEAFAEYNSFGLAEMSDNYKLPDKDRAAMKARSRDSTFLELGWLLRPMCPAARC